MNPDRESRSDVLKREMFVHLQQLRDQCDELIAAKYPLDVFNKVHSLSSIVGQLASASRRWREIS